MKSNFDVMAYSLTEMKGVSKGVIEYKLNVRRDAKPVKQPKRNFALERQEVIKEEVNKLLDAKFISEVMYLDWLTNVMLVKKANDKWRVCIDFVDLNKSCPKDSYPLSRIDQLVDSTVGHELLSFQ